MYAWSLLSCLFFRISGRDTPESRISQPDIEIFRREIPAPVSWPRPCTEVRHLDRGHTVSHPVHGMKTAIESGHAINIAPAWMTRIGKQHARQKVVGYFRGIKKSSKLTWRSEPNIRVTYECVYHHKLQRYRLPSDQWANFSMTFRTFWSKF